jgi:hypothetical protein
VNTRRPHRCYKVSERLTSAALSSTPNCSIARHIGSRVGDESEFGPKIRSAVAPPKERHLGLLPLNAPQTAFWDPIPRYVAQRRRSGDMRPDLGKSALFVGIAP